MSLEVEMKFAVQDLGAMRTELVALGASLESSERMVDTYLQHPSRSFAATDEALRVRQIGSQLRVTYKGPKLDRTTKTRTEIEMEFAPQVKAGELSEFWKHLSFSIAGAVEKDRETFGLDWQGWTCHICLDRVVGLGEYVEVELTAEPEQLEESRQVIKALSNRLGLKHSERRSYLELLLDKGVRKSGAGENHEDWHE